MPEELPGIKNAHVTGTNGEIMVCCTKSNPARPTARTVFMTGLAKGLPKEVLARAAGLLQGFEKDDNEARQQLTEINRFKLPL